MRELDRRTVGRAERKARGQPLSNSGGHAMTLHGSKRLAVDCESLLPTVVNLGGGEADRILMSLITETDTILV